MKKTTKGAIAAAGVLLLAGACTVAYWSDNSTIAESTVTTGNLTLIDADCGAGWTCATGNAGVGSPVNLLVPGDAISKTCTFQVAATGDNLEADLTTPDAEQIDPGCTSTLEATVAAEYTVGQTAATTSTTELTPENNGDEVTATITAASAFGEEDAINANDTQGFTATLDDVDVTLVQTESLPWRWGGWRP